MPDKLPTVYPYIPNSVPAVKQEMLDAVQAKEIDEFYEDVPENLRLRGALDVHAKTINDEMKVAASLALAKLAKEDVPDEVASAYGVSHLEFGPEYIIPKPFDPRVLMWEASAVAQAAMDSGVAEKTIDIEDYKDQLEARLGGGREMMRTIIHKAQKDPKRIVFPEGTSERIIRASSQIINEKIAIPILLGDPNKIQAEAGWF